MGAGDSGLEAFRDLERFLADAAQARSGLGVLEPECERRGRELVRLALQAHLDARGSGDIGPVVVVDGPGGPVRLKRRRSPARRVLTLFGEIRIRRVGYSAVGTASLYPLDAELALPARCWSYELSRRLVRATVCGPFDEAIGLVAESTGVRIPKRSAEQVVVDAGVDVEAFYAARRGIRPDGGDVLVAAIDCKGIPMVRPDPAPKVVRRRKGEKANKKKMATVGAVHAQAPHIRTAGEVVASLFDPPGDNGSHPRRQRSGKRVWASLTSDKDTFIADVRAEMERRDPDRAHTWVVVTDGERALQRRVTKIFDDITLVLDLLHVLDKLWKAAHVFHPEGTPEAIAFVRARTERILGGGVSQVVKGLRQMSTKRALRGTRAKTIHDVTAYLYANRESACATTPTSRSPAAPSKALARTSFATAWNAQACDGANPWPKRCSVSEPPTCRAI
ncbi:MAG: hypothetical protein ACRD0C_20705, partial [Acidimicrobiia bacterium]